MKLFLILVLMTICNALNSCPYGVDRYCSESEECNCSNPEDPQDCFCVPFVPPTDEDANDNDDLLDFKASRTVSNCSPTGPQCQNGLRCLCIRLNHMLPPSVNDTCSCRR